MRLHYARIRPIVADGMTEMTGFRRAAGWVPRQWVYNPGHWYGPAYTTIASGDTTYPTNTTRMTGGGNLRTASQKRSSSDDGHHGTASVIRSDV